MILEPPAERIPAWRVAALGLAIAGGMSVLLANLWKLQIVEYEQRSSQITNQITRAVVLPPARGRIVDRNKIPLAENQKSIDIDIYLPEVAGAFRKRHGYLPERQVEIYRGGVRQRKKEIDAGKIVSEAIEPLQRILSQPILLDPDSLQLHQRIRGNTPYTLATGIDFKEVAIWFERNPAIPGVEIVYRPVRRYAWGASAPHILGYVARPENPKLIDRDGQRIEVFTVGKTGIESFFDDHLQGSPGTRSLLVDYLGTVQKVLGQENPTLGDTVYLTIDARYQQIVEQVLHDNDVGRAACVVLDVRSGDILAMASLPNFDPNTITTGDGWRAVAQNDAKPLINRALASYPPGSIFKPIVALAALKHNTVDPRSFHTFCSGGMFVVDRFKKCWSHDKGGCGGLNMQGAIKRSCNTYFYDVGIRTGGANVAEMGQLLGLGEKTGIPLPSESPGCMPGPEWMKRARPRERWSNGHMANTAIGQGDVLATPLQMAVVSAAIANGGTVYHPRLIKEIRNYTNAVVFNNPTRIRSILDIPPERIEIVRRGMRDVVNETGGTARSARLPDVVISGKTGTAQFMTRLRGRPVKDNRTWFIAFAPYDLPTAAALPTEARYAICLVVEGGRSGGATSAPLVRAIFERIIELERQRAFQLTYLHPDDGHLRGLAAVTPTSDYTPTDPANVIPAATDSTPSAPTPATIVPAAAPPPAAPVAAPRKPAPKPHSIRNRRDPRFR